MAGNPRPVSPERMVISHVGRFAAGRQLRRCGVLVAIEEQQPRAAGGSSQGRRRAEQYRAIFPVHHGEVLPVQNLLHDVLVNCVRGARARVRGEMKPPRH